MDTPALNDDRLRNCPDRPKCISSDARDRRRWVAPLSIAGEVGTAWRTTREVVTGLPRTRVVAESDDYLHVEIRSLVFRFIDDLELHLRPQKRLVALRSSSRIGYSDLGVNRRRIERLRHTLRLLGVVD